MYSVKIPLYEDREDVTLTTYIQDDASKLLSAERPAILICPGGGYLKCASQEGEPVALRFASMGYHTFVLRYSTYFQNENQVLLEEDSSKVPVKEHTLYPNPMLEVGLAMKLIKKNAQKWQIDTERIALCGFSAGAHNAAMYAASWHESWIAQRLGTNQETLRPAAVILGYMAGDYFFRVAEDEGGKQSLLQSYSHIAMFGKPELDREDVEKVQPSRFVTAKMPPAFLWATCKDSVVSVKNTLTMAGKLQEEEVPFELHIFEEGDHGLSLAGQESAKNMRQVRADVGQWVTLAQTWLEKRFALVLPE